MIDSVLLKKLKVHHDWKTFLTKENVDLLVQLETEILKVDFTPETGNVLRFLEMPLQSAKIIILGQDPYPQSGAATGRAFEVGTLKSWNAAFKNVSLKNILRSMYQAYSGKTLKFNEIKQKFDNEFPLLPPDKLFAHWEKQGVLLLNTSFTCEKRKPGSHQKLWEAFTLRLLNFINENRSEITWFLWGNHALQATKNLKINNKITTQHPMMCYDAPDRDNDFLFGNVNCFKKFIPEIDWTGFNLSSGIKSSEKLF